MLLTCITTVFNDGALLRNSVRSILGQSMTDFEFLIVDDGSGPETLAILDSLNDPRLRVIRQANDGLSSARNRALEQAKGDYICFLDADDNRPNWAFAAAARAIAAHQPDVILTPGVLQEVRGEVKTFYDQPIFDQLNAALQGRPVRRGDADFASIRALAHRTEPQSANKFLSRAFLKRTGLGFPNGHFFEDIYFHTGAIAMADSLAFLDTPTFAYFRRYGRAQITSTNGERRMDTLAVARLTLDSFARRPEFADPLLRGAVLVAVLRILAWCASEVSHAARPGFHLALQAMLRLIDPEWLALDWLTQDAAAVPPELGDVSAARAFVRAIRSPS
ncbi:glycosyltransferase family 2 protein [Rhodobacter sp. KR11]|uniref:glycosyltransferase family 2 protein n=1 Tax=Rhodobacter sp. KR11 TaxID=2974588 RepID=UPI002221FF8D|nr:glycosyltransferase family A protein [Rhodobacter sp. KR11]MCW1918301.1 glycosyltransferase family 2 protein [Rhodobacter sp. KR11]